MRQLVGVLMAGVLGLVGAIVACQAQPAPRGGGATEGDASARTGTTTAPATTTPGGTYMVGADMSWVQQRQDAGTRYSDQGVVKDVFAILKDHGFNFIRFRVFNDPTKPNAGNRVAYSTRGYCDLPHTIAMAQHVKQLGFGLLIDFHYSDGWADPAKQYAPAAWVGQTPEQASKSLHDWTKDAIEQFKKAGAVPDMVQVGNEITPGMMTDLGGTTTNWPVLASFLKSGIAAAREVDPKIQIMLHIDRGGDNAGTRAWVDAALAQGVAFDVLGLSCYARWQGPPAQWKANFADLATRYPTLKFVMAEVDAQAEEANEIMMGLPAGRGLGTFIWEPTANNANQGLFDTRGAVLPERMAAYDKVVEKYHLANLH